MATVGTSELADVIEALSVDSIGTSDGNDGVRELEGITALTSGSEEVDVLSVKVLGNGVVELWNTLSAEVEALGKGPINVELSEVSVDNPAGVVELGVEVVVIESLIALAVEGTTTGVVSEETNGSDVGVDSKVVEGVDSNGVETIAAAEDETEATGLGVSVPVDVVEAVGTEKSCSEAVVEAGGVDDATSSVVDSVKGDELEGEGASKSVALPVDALAVDLAFEGNGEPVVEPVEANGEPVVDSVFEANGEPVVDSVFDANGDSVSRVELKAETLGLPAFVVLGVASEEAVAYSGLGISDSEPVVESVEVPERKFVTLKEPEAVIDSAFVGVEVSSFVVEAAGALSLSKEEEAGAVFSLATGLEVSFVAAEPVTETFSAVAELDFNGLAVSSAFVVLEANGLEVFA